MKHDIDYIFNESEFDECINTEERDDVMNQNNISLTEDNITTKASTQLLKFKKRIKRSATAKSAQADTYRARIVNKQELVHLNVMSKKSDRGKWSSRLQYSRMIC